MHSASLHTCLQLQLIFNQPSRRLACYSPHNSEHLGNCYLKFEVVLQLLRLFTLLSGEFLTFCLNFSSWPHSPTVAPNIRELASRIAFGVHSQSIFGPVHVPSAAQYYGSAFGLIPDRKDKATQETTIRL